MRYRRQNTWQADLELLQRSKRGGRNDMRWFLSGEMSTCTRDRLPSPLEITPYPKLGRGVPRGFRRNRELIKVFKRSRGVGPLVLFKMIPNIEDE